jgi:hypothetical protein
MVIPPVMLRLLTFVAEAPQRHKTDHLPGMVQPIEWCACPFIEDTSSVTTTKAMIPHLSPIRAFGCGRRLAIGTPLLHYGIRMG